MKDTKHPPNKHCWGQKKMINGALLCIESVDSVVWFNYIYKVWLFFNIEIYVIGWYFSF
jgi:hypothetical protein